MLLASGLALMSVPRPVGVGPSGCESCGVISCVYSRAATVGKLHHETVRSVRVLRAVMERTVVYPTALIANGPAVEALRTLGALHLWEARRHLVMVPAIDALLNARNQSAHDASPFLWKLSALLTSSFERTLFLDADVYVVWPSFVSTLLRGSLAIGDVAWPIDIPRYMPQWRNVPAPMHCSCVVAYRNSALVQRWMVGAAARLIKRTNRGVRQGDQEMLHFEWVSSRTELRMVSLPEEYFCPKVRYDGHNHSSPVWTNSWPKGHYNCKAVHSHHETDDKIARVLKGTRWAFGAAGGAASHDDGRIGARARARVL